MDKTISDVAVLPTTAVYDHAPHGVLLTDVGLMVRGWNAWLEAHSGTPAAAVVGRHLRDIVPDFERRAVDAAYQGALAGAVITLDDGSAGVLPLPAPPNTAGFQAMQQECRIAPLRDGDHIVGTITFITDVTERAALARRDEALATVTHALGEVGLRPNALLDTVARLATELIGDLTILWLVAADGRTLEAGATYHPNAAFLATVNENIARVTHPVGAGVNGRVVVTGVAERLNADTLDDMARHLLPAHARNLSSAPTYSLLVVPLRVRDRTIGTLSVSRQTAARPYSAADQAFLQELADRAALAIEFARLFRAERVARADAERLVERAEQVRALTTALAAATTPARVGALSLEHITAALGASHADLYGVGTDDDDFVPLATLSDSTAHDAQVLLDDASIIDEVARTGQALWPAAAVDATASEAAAGQLIAVPLLSEGQCIGAIAFAFDAPRSFSPAERTFIETMAAQTALALVRARLADTEARARRRLAFLSEASQVLAMSLDETTTLARVARLAIPTLSDICLVDLLDDGHLRHTTVAHVDPAAEEQVRQMRHTYQPALDWTGHLLADVLRTGQPALLADPRDVRALVDATARTDEHRQMMRALHYHSYMVVPLVARGRILGAMSFMTSVSRRRFTTEDRDLAVVLARRCAMAIDNARLFAETRAEEERFRTSVENLLDCFGIYSAIRDEAGRIVDFRIDYVNGAAAASMNRPVEEIVGHTLAERLPGHVTAGLIETYARVVETGEPFARDSMVYEDTYDGHIQHKALDVRVTRLGDGFVAAWRDVTDRARTEAAVRASEERFRTLAGAVPSMVWTAAPDGTITYANDQWYAYCGLAPEENATRWPELVVHPDDRARCLAQWSDALRTGTDYAIEVRNRRFDGEYRWFLTRAAPMRDAAGQVTSWFGTTTDIHEHKQAEAEREELVAQLQASEARYRGLFNGVADAIIVFTEDGRYVEANQAAAALTGYSQSELLQLSIGDLSGEPQAVRAGWPALMAAGGWHGEANLRHRDGRDIPVETWVTSTALPTGRVYISAMRDIRVRRALERQQQEFLAMISHDLKTPLTGISGMAQLMQRRGAYSERSVGVIIDQTRHMQRLIDDLLDLARQDAGQLELRCTNFDLAQLVKTVAEATLAASPAHPLHLSLPDQPVIGAWDHDRLTQLLHNLLSNAIKYSPNGGPVRVALDHEGDAVRLAVQDEGIGIAATEVPHLFDRYYRAGRARDGVIGGLGLGLAIALAIVEAHGGRITVESVEGAGSTFTVTLPVASYQ